MGRKPHSYAFVRQTFKDANCVLESTEDDYVNQKTLLDFICSCGNRDRRCFSHFQINPYCRECGRKLVASKRRNTYEEVKNTFKGAGLTLVTPTYEGIFNELIVECRCGREYPTTLDKFQHGVTQCGYCSEYRQRTVEEVRAELADQEVELLDNEFLGVNYKMNLLCKKCKTEGRITYHEFEQGRPVCPCRSMYRTYTLEIVRQIFERRKCKLLADTYKDRKTRMPYQCKCGRFSEISLASFLDGHYCNECGRRKAAATRRQTLADREQIFNSDEPPVLIDEMRGQIQ